jgi:DNA ligase-1
MKALADLIEAFRQPNRQDRLNLLRDCISRRESGEAVHIIHLLSGRLPKRSVTRKQLRNWAAEAADIPLWLFDDSLESVGDFAEATALVIPWTEASAGKPFSHWMNYVMALPGLSESVKKERIISAWRQLHPSARILFNRLITGNFRTGIPPKDLIHVLASISSTRAAIIAQRLARNWTPDTTSLDDLLGSAGSEDDLLRPYPFSLASLLHDSPERLGQPGDWQAEWLWDGLRAQLIKQRGHVCVWSRTEELLTESFPELCAGASLLADGTVLDGEIAALDGKRILPPSLSFSRSGRRPPSFRRARPVFIVHDILEQQGSDIRTLSLRERRAFLASSLKALPQNDVFRLSLLLPTRSWEKLARLKERGREYGAKGIILKRLASRYHPGRDHGEWWKWKASPLSIIAVLLYSHTVREHQAQPSAEYTCAVWDHGRLIPCVRTGVGLAEEEIAEIQAFVRENTVKRFGPVRTVPPALVFEIGFDAIHPSPRRKSGVALISPRILRWHRDKKPDDAETLERLRGLATQAFLREA